ncbi:MAG TPA: hypothetical protein VGJ63_21005 [Micromonosporaceae bacterium]
MGTDPGAAWREQRQRAVEAHARAQEERRAAEMKQARQLIATFVRVAGEQGLAPTALTAPAYHGRGRYRTRLRGWYLDRGRSLAVDTDGEFYVLGVPNSIRARLTGANVKPQPPPLVVGEGGRDGESIPLRQLLQRRLDAGAEPGD